MTAHANNGVWQTTAPYAHNGAAWQTVQNGYYHDGVTWREFFTSAPVIIPHTVSTAYSSGVAVCTYDPASPFFQTTCNADEVALATVSNGVGPFTYQWTEIADSHGKFSIVGSSTSASCTIRSAGGNGTYTATFRCTVTDTGNGNLTAYSDYNLSHSHEAI